MLLDSGTRIAIVGGGAMGAGIAQVAATAGHDVVVVDVKPAALERGRSVIDASLIALLRKGQIEASEQARIQDRIRWSNALADASDCGLAIEAIVERLDAKRALFAALAQALPAGAVLASNTSSLSIAAIATAVPDPHRVLGLHFFNPVPLMKLVEVVAAPHTDRNIAATAAALIRRWGKHPVNVADVPGFIVNRVARPYYAEAFAALGEGIAPATIDRALTASGGFRMGPLALADMIGHDVNYTVATSVYDGYAGNTRFRPQPSQRALVAAGTLGRKSGAGIYDYRLGIPDPVLAPAAAPPRGARAAKHDGVLADLCRAAGIVPQAAAASGDGIVVDGVRILRCDGRPLSTRADADVLVDAVRNLATAGTIVLTARSAQAAAVAAGLVQAGRRDALLIPDRPGMIVTRTLAQLANAGADAVADGIADAAGIDDAMCYGANHPEGPLAWARRTGFDRVAAVLANVADATKDEMYRPAALLTGNKRR